VYIVNAIKKNETITSLDLRGNGIKAEGAKAIAEMLMQNTSILRYSSQNVATSTLTKLRLNLEWNSVGLWDLGVKAISDALLVNSTLVELDLRNNRIGPQGTL
jgi:Ran GTPase-activating protein (RanGAP) involved in mRNA processing and transport